MRTRDLLRKLAEDFEKNLSKGTLIEPVKFFVGYPEFTADIKGGGLLLPEGKGCGALRCKGARVRRSYLWI